MPRKTDPSADAGAERAPDSMNPAVSLPEALGAMATDPGFTKSPTLPTGVVPTPPGPPSDGAPDPDAPLPAPPATPGDVCAAGCGRAVGIAVGELPFHHAGAPYCARCFAKSPEGIALHAEAVRCVLCGLVCVRVDSHCPVCRHGNLLPCRDSEPARAP